MLRIKARHAGNGRPFPNVATLCRRLAVNAHRKAVFNNLLCLNAWVSGEDEILL
jgi:hypothetical protein